MEKRFAVHTKKMAFWKDPNFWMKIFVCGIILLVSLSFTIDAWSHVDQMTETQYSCEELSYEMVELFQGSATAEVRIADEQITRIEIPLTSTGMYSGTLLVRIYDGETMLFEQDVLGSGMIINNRIVLDVGQSGLVKDYTYRLEFTSDLSGPVTVKIADNKMVECVQYFRFTDGALYKAFLILCNVLLLAVFLICACCNMEIHSLFFVVALLIGVIMVFATPPLSIPDEYRHFVRVYQISEGDIIATEYSQKDAYWIGCDPFAECDFPKELAALKLINNSSSKTYAGEIVLRPFLEKWKDMFHATFSGETVRTMYMVTNTISPLAYIPQVIGALIAKFSSVPVWQFYGARLATLIINVLVIYLAIKKAPYFKNLFFAIAMLPDVVIARSSCSTDGLLMALVLLLLAWVLEIKNRNNCEITKQDWVMFLLLSVMIGSIKLPYLLVFLILFLIDGKMIPQKNMPRLAGNVLSVLAIVGVGMVISLGTQMILGIHAPEGYPSTNVSYLLENPVSVLNLVAQTLITNHETYILDAFGVFGALYFAYCFTIVQFDTCPVLGMKDRVVLFVIYLGFLVGLTFGGYFMNVPLITYIWGIQSRYFIPALPALFMLGSGLHKETDAIRTRNMNMLTRLIVSGCAVIALLTNTMQYYV